MPKFPGREFSSQGFWDFGTAQDHNTQYPDQTGFIEDNFGSNQKRNSPNSVSNLNQYHLYQVETGSGWTNRINGTQVLAISPNAVAFPDYPTIGKSASLYFGGNIAEILIFTGILSSNDNSTVTNYLKQKYSLP